MRASLALPLLALAACHPSATTPAERVQQSASDQRKLAAFPPDGNPRGNVVGVDNDAATPTDAGRAQP